MGWHSCGAEFDFGVLDASKQRGVRLAVVSRCELFVPDCPFVILLYCRSKAYQELWRHSRDVRACGGYPACDCREKAAESGSAVKLPSAAEARAKMAFG